jgi:hypothetical protein
MKNKKTFVVPIPDTFLESVNVILLAVTEVAKGNIKESEQVTLRQIYGEPFWELLGRAETAGFGSRFRQTCETYGFQYAGQKGTSSLYRIITGD